MGDVPEILDFSRWFFWLWDGNYPRRLPLIGYHTSFIPAGDVHVEEPILWKRPDGCHGYAVDTRHHILLARVNGCKKVYSCEGLVPLI